MATPNDNTSPASPFARSAWCAAIGTTLAVASVARAQSSAPGAAGSAPGTAPAKSPTPAPVSSISVKGVATAGTAGAAQSAPAPAPTDDPGADPTAELKPTVWGVPGPNAAQGGVSTPLTGPGGRPPSPTMEPPSTPGAPAGAGAAVPASRKPDAKVDVTSEGRFSLSAQAIDVSKLLELISIS